ncbi:large ribosomal subunit protein uL13-like [Artemia franciscana]|uniref:large ribosomal subunit protein uL13-like n=1 Tax=Artemia franciscana TaxID=6661 RepID=UPI0032DA7064
MSRPIIIDASGHLMGRLSTVVAKSLLNGNKVIVLRAEEINISGTFYRAKLKYLRFLKKRCNVNPARGPFHHRAPSKIFERAVRGMIPYKTTRGRQAMKRLRAYEGVPPKYQRMTKQIAPRALRAVALKPGRKYCKVGRLSHEVGWKYQNVTATLEAKRKVKAAVAYRNKKHIMKMKEEEKKHYAKKMEPYQRVIESYGFK